MRFSKKIFSATVICAVLFLLHSCNSGNDKSSVNKIFSSDFVDVTAFKTAIESSLPVCDVNDTTFKQRLLKDNDGLLNASYAYKLNNYEPLWMDASGLKPFVNTLIAQLASLQEEGMDTGKYNLTALQEAIGQMETQKEIPLNSLVAFDKNLTRTWLMASKDLLCGTIEIKKADSLWFAKNDALFYGASLLVNVLKTSNELPSLDTFRSDSKTYGQMKRALAHWQLLNSDTNYLTIKKEISTKQNNDNLISVFKKELPYVMIENDTLNNNKTWIATYQYYHQLKPTGLLDSNTIKCLKRMPDDYIAMIRMNMDRIRALPRNIEEGEYVWVTIPLMEVNYYKGGQVLFHDRVVVGTVSRQTPSLWANMTNVVFNPPWGVPPTILKNDVGPGVTRSGSAYLAKKGLRAYDSKGNDVTWTVNGSNYKRYTYRQPPGAGNSLGEVKFNLPNAWDIYLHDTPHRENFSNRFRALSSGCVRVQNPKLLAEIILNDERFTADKIDTIISTRKTKTEKLGRRLPVYIIYTTIAEDSTGNQLRYLTDVYKRDERMLKFY